MVKKLDIEVLRRKFIGHRSHKLVAIDIKYDKRWRILCQCDCGNKKWIEKRHFEDGTTASCGCLSFEQRSMLNRKHGLTNHPLFSVWRGMRRRCNGSSPKDAKLYLEKGIKVCPEWETSFENFYNWAIANGYDESKAGNFKLQSLDRIDGDGDYCPENCRFVDAYVQENNRCIVKRFEYKGQMLTYRDIINISGISKYKLYRRLELKHMTVEQAIQYP